MNETQILLGKDVITIEINGVYDKFYDWEWWRPNGLATREVYSDGEVIIYPQFENKDGDILHLNGFTRKRVNLEREVI